MIKINVNCIPANCDDEKRKEKFLVARIKIRVKQLVVHAKFLRTIFLKTHLHIQYDAI